ncbi:MAG: ABC transporter permease [Candidatus Eremiobacteraeota bacterium]|nr:ABC transporter permease [Candidatus Eremiobacteraeota bacterium]
MLLPILRNLLRQPVRSALTVAGIAIGVLALTVVGALSSQLSRIVTRSERVQNAVLAFVQQSAVARLHNRRRQLQAQLSHVDGVAAVIPEVIVPYDYGANERDRFGPPRLIFGLPPAALTLLHSTLNVGAGSDALGAGRAAAIGSDFARSENATVGDVIALYGSSYRVAGVYQQSFTIFDAAVVVPLPEAQRILLQALPLRLTTRSKGDDLATNFILLLRPGADSSLVAGRVDLIEGLRATDPKRVSAGLAATTRVFNSIVYGAALIALVIGSLSIVNTMTTAVRERTREIGIRKAVGATDGAILVEFITESAFVGTFGGVFGILAGLIICAVLNARAQAQGTLQLFDLSLGLAAAALLFSVVLGAVSGLAPAWSAARLNPTEALRRL